ncbi:MAG TPA: hypothetical protein VJ742_13375 [Nitrososphaera sp.]|nr:hypothetical protein [Nitrososphaera sp.]
MLRRRGPFPAVERDEQSDAVVAVEEKVKQESFTVVPGACPQRDDITGVPCILGVHKGKRHTYDDEAIRLHWDSD